MSGSTTDKLRILGKMRFNEEVFEAFVCKLPFLEKLSYNQCIVKGVKRVADPGSPKKKKCPDKEQKNLIRK